MESEIYPRAVLGYRVWIWRPSGLWSLGMGDTRWDAVIQENARCLLDCGDHSAPDPECSCGFYANHSLAVTLASLSVSEISLDLNGPGAEWPRVLMGAVAGSGETQIHATGWRAARAQIIALYRPTHSPYRPDAARLAESLGVPLVETTGELERRGLAAAEPAPRDLIPDSLPPQERDPSSRPVELTLPPVRALWREDKLLGAAAAAEITAALLVALIPLLVWWVVGSAGGLLISLLSIWLCWPVAFTLAFFEPLQTRRIKKLWRVPPG